MSREEALLALIGADPSDDAPRLVYADWLSDQGEPDKAAFLRAQVAGEERSLGPLEPAWLARVDRTRILNCGLHRRLRHYCPQRWQDLLLHSRDGRTRFCAECTALVRHCATGEEAEALAQEGQIVALSSLVRGYPAAER